MHTTLSKWLSTLYLHKNERINQDGPQNVENTSYKISSVNKTKHTFWGTYTKLSMYNQ